MTIDNDITENITISLSQYDYFRDMETRTRLLARKLKKMNPDKSYYGWEIYDILGYEPDEEEEKA